MTACADALVRWWLIYLPLGVAALVLVVGGVGLLIGSHRFKDRF